MIKKAAKNFTESCDVIYNKNRGTLWATVTTYMPGERAEALNWNERSLSNMKNMIKKAAKNFTESCDVIYNKNHGTL